MADKLSQYAYYNVCDVFTSATDCLNYLEDNKVDLVLIDVNIQSISGLDLLKEIKKLYPKIKTIMLSENIDLKIIKDAYEIGTNCYISKSSNEEEILDLIENVIKGGIHYGKISFEDLLNKPRLVVKIPNYKNLSKRENEMINFLYSGLKYKEIGNKLKISTLTVKKHCQNLYNKLGLSGADELRSLIDKLQ